MPDVEIKVNAESNAAQVFTQDAQAVSAAQSSMSQTTVATSAATKEAATSSSALNSVMAETTTALSTVSGEMGEVVKSASEMASKIGEAVGEEGGLGFLGLAGAATLAIGAMASMGASGAGLATQISQVSAVTGMSIEKTDFWGNALSDVGGSVNSLVMVNRLLTNSIQSVADAQSSGNPLTQKQSDLLKALGGSAMDAHGEVKSFGDAFPQIIDRLSSMTDEQERAKAGTEIFGRAWAQVSLLIAEYPKVAGAAEEQTKRNAAAMEDANDTAVNYHIAMHNLETEYDALALRFAKPLTLTLTVTGNIFDFIGKDKSNTLAGQLDAEIFKDAGNAINFLSGTVDRYTASAGASLGVTSSLDANTTLLSTTASQAGNAAEAAAAGIRSAGGAAGAAAPQASAAAGAFSALLSAMAGGGAIFKEFTSSTDAQVIADFNSIKATALKSDEMEKAYQMLLKSSDPKEHAIGQEHADAEAKKDSAAAQSALNGTVQGYYDQIVKQAQATANQTEAQREYNAEMGITTDLEGKAIPTMQDLVNQKLDSIDASKRDAEATREANLQRGIQVDINGKAVKSFQDMVNEEKASILQSQQMAKATEEANRELGITSDSAKTTASSMDSLTTSLNNNTTAWHQQSDAESQAAAKAKQPTSAAGGASSGASAGASTGSGGSVAFFSHGSGGGAATVGPVNPAYNPPAGTIIDSGFTDERYYDASNQAIYKYNTRPSVAQRLASGLESVPYDGYPALLDKGERVQTAAEVARGGDTGGSNQPINITLQIPGLPDYIVRVVRNKALQGGFYGVPLGAH